MIIREKLTYKLNELAAKTDKSQYVEGKLDGINIALRELDTHMNIYLVHVSSEQGVEADVIAHAKTCRDAEILVAADAKEFPEFSNGATYLANCIGLSEWTEPKTRWM